MSFDKFSINLMKLTHKNIIKLSKSQLLGICLGVIALLIYFLIETTFHFFSGMLSGLSFTLITGLVSFDKKRKN